MKKFSIRVYVIYMGIVIISFIFFALAYSAIQDKYIANVVCNSLVMMDSEGAVKVNSRINDDYKEFTHLVDDIVVSEDDELDLYNQYVSLNHSYEAISSYKVGYVLAETMYLDGNEYNYKTSKTFDETYFDNPVSFYSFNEFIDFGEDAEDTHNYTIFKYKNLLMYMETRGYLDEIISTIEGMPTNYYMIVDYVGGVSFQKDETRYERIYSHVNEITEEIYLELLGDLSNEGYSTIQFDKFEGKSFFVHVPLVSSLSKVERDGKTINTYSLVYVFQKTDAMVSQNYLRWSLLATFIMLFLVINLALIICIIMFFRKEQDMSSSKLRFFFAKPYVLVINRFGRIKDKNRTFTELVRGGNEYRSIKDFEIYEQDLDPDYIIKNQKSFTALVHNHDSQLVYIRFIPMKIFGGYALLGEDVTETMIDNIRNSKIALYNNITNLPNRNVLTKDLKDIIDSRRLDRNLFSLVGFDAIDFAKINKMFGFASGDKLLREVATRLQDSIRQYNAKLYNVRTSQFYILFSNLISYNDVVNWSKSVLQVFEEPIEIKNDYLTNIEVKIGIYNIANQDKITPNLIYECAYSALEKSINSRLSKVSIYNAEYGMMLSRDQIMEQDLQVAIKNKDFEMYYQPQYNTKIGKIIGFEALVRWDNPKYKNESPEHYVTIAERNGMIVELGKIIIEKTFEFAKLLEDSGLHISMNVSPAQLMHAGFVNMLLNYYNEFKLKPNVIAIEITETFLMENQALMIDKLKVLRDHGFSTHLDDFGIGYSSMLYLKDLPIDTIKIDKDFTKNLEHDRYSRAIVNKISQLGLGLDLNIIVEGVENERQMNILSKMGCDVIQGYLISKPVNTIETLALIKKYNGINLATDDITSKEFENIEEVSGPVAKKKEKKKKGPSFINISSSSTIDDLINNAVENSDTDSESGSNTDSNVDVDEA